MTNYAFQGVGRVLKLITALAITFYTSGLFRLERLVLTLAARPSSDVQAAELCKTKLHQY